MTATGITFVGAGMVAELHHQALASVEELSLVGVLDLDQRRGGERADAWGVRAFTSLDELLGAPEVEAVAVLTPPESHTEIALAALSAGKHVLIEKPMANEPQEIERILAAAGDRVVMPGHNYAYIPEFRRLARLARGGELGTVRALWITYAIAHPEEIASAYGGVLEEVMVHHAYLALSVLGPPESICAGVAEPAWESHQVEDQAWATWVYPGGVSAHLFASFAVGDESADPWTFVVKALGTSGSASMSWRTGSFRRALGSLSVGIPAYEESYEHELRAFARAISTGAQPDSAAGDALVAARLLVASYEAARERRTIDRHENGRRRW